MAKAAQSDGRPLLPLFFIAIAALSLFWHPSAFSNDDVGQAAGLYFLSHGELGVTKDLPEGFDPLLGGLFHHFSIPKDDRTVAPFDSTALNVVALPGLAILNGLTYLVGFHGSLALVQSTVLGLGVWSALNLGRPHANKLWAAAPAVVLLPGALLRTSTWPTSPYLEFAAIELVNMAAMALAATLLFDLVRRFLPERNALVAAALFLFGTPAFFWALGGKDHAISIALLAVAMWCYRDGHKSDATHTFAAFAVNGLLMWHHFRLGLFLFASLGLIASPAMRLGVRPLLIRVGAAIGGLLPGIGLDAWQRWILARQGITGDWGDVGTPVPGGDTLNLKHLVTKGQLSHSVITEPLGVLDTLRQTFLWTDWMDVGVSLSFLCMFPLLALVVRTLAVGDLRRSLPRPVLVFCCLYPTLYFLIGGTALLGHGFGFDMRYAASLWPIVVVLAAPALGEVLDRGHALFIRRAVSVGVPFLAISLSLILVLRALYGIFTPQGNLFDETVFMRYGGLAVGLVLVATSIGLRWRPGWVPGHDWLVAAAAGMVVQFQAFLQLGLGKLSPPLSAPFVAWPIDWVARGIRWMLYP